MLLVLLRAAAISIADPLAWPGGCLLTTWDAITAGYRLAAIKP